MWECIKAEYSTATSYTGVDRSFIHKSSISFERSVFSLLHHIFLLLFSKRHLVFLNSVFFLKVGFMD